MSKLPRVNDNEDTDVPRCTCGPADHGLNGTLELWTNVQGASRGSQGSLLVKTGG